MNASTQHPPGRTDWALVILAFLSGVVCAFQVGKVPVALTDLRADLGLNLIAASWVISMYSMVAVVGGLVAGVMVARFGDRASSVLGLLILAAGGAMGAVSDSAAVILVSRFIEGAGFLFTQIAAVALVHRYAVPGDQRFAFGLWGSYMGVGQAGIMLAAPAILFSSGWRGLWLANVAISLLFAAVMFIAARRPGPAHATRPPAATMNDLAPGIRTTFTANGPLALSACFACYSFNYSAMVGFLPTILVELANRDATQSALLTALAVAFNACGNLMGGVFLQRGATRWKLILFAHLVLGGLAIGVFSAAAPFGLRLAFTLAGLMVGGMIPACLFGAVARFSPAPQLAPMVNGVMIQGSSLGQVLGPPAVAAVATATGMWDWSAGVEIAAALAGVALALRIRKLEAAAR